jgi:hypothetical protein
LCARPTAPQARGGRSRRRPPESRTHRPREGPRPPYLEAPCRRVVDLPRPFLLPLFTQVPRETVRKGVRATLKACIWLVYGGRKGPKHLFSWVCKATLQVASRFFGQFQKKNSRKFATRKQRQSNRKNTRFELCARPWQRSKLLLLLVTGVVSDAPEERERARAWPSKRITR